MINILICDDEQLWVENIKLYSLQYFNQNLKNGTFNFNTLVDYKKACEYVQNNKVDIALLDIDLLNNNGDIGIELAQVIRQNNEYAVIIFITSHPEFALNAYQVHGFGFLVKPFYQAEIESILKESLIFIRGVHKAVNNMISINKSIKIRENNIICVETNNRVLDIYTTQGIFNVKMTLKKFYEKLNKTSFIYVKKNAIINTEYVVSCKRNICTLAGGKEIVISEKYNVKEHLFNPQL